MPRDPKTPFTPDEMARSFVTAFLKTAQKEVSIRNLISTAQAMVANNAFKHDQRGAAKIEACQPDRIRKAARELSLWGQIVLVQPDVYCLQEFMPKFRTLDDTWLS